MDFAKDASSMLPTRITLSLVIYGPTTTLPGSASIYFIQPLLNGRIPFSVGVLIGVELFLFLAQHFFGLDSIPGYLMQANQLRAVTIPVDQLQELLRSIAKCSPRMTPETGGQALDISGQSGALTVEPPAEDPLIIGLSISADYSNVPFSPAPFFLLPILTFPELTGSLPLIIILLLNTIFIRAVVPPEATGAKPAPKVKPKSPI